MKIKIVLLLLFASSNVFALTTGNIISQVRLMERDCNSDNYRYTDQTLIDRINIIQDEISAKTFCIQKRYYISTSSSTQEYRLPSDCQNIIRVGYLVSGSTDAYKKLPYTTIAGQDKENGYWQNLADGTPKEYYRRADYVGLVPVPSDAYSGTNYIQLDYNTRASSVSLTTDIPLNGNYNLYAFHQAIIYGVAAMCEYDKGNIANYGALQTVYNDWLTRIKEIYYTEPDKNLNFTK